MLRANIHSFESFGTVDGPGIRHVTFFQGCVLGCLYCHNRDTWNPRGGFRVSVDELVAKVRKLLPFLEPSDGGVTATGGEALYQPAFVSEYFHRCKEELAISTALDTSGAVALSEPVCHAIGNTDYVLLDIKHMDPQRHTELTTKSNDLVFEFAQYLKEQQKRIWIRHVVIPGYTDDWAHVEELTDYISSLGVERIDILPYHEIGMHKWELLGFKYPLTGTPTPSKELIASIVDYMQAKGLNAF